MEFPRGDDYAQGRPALATGCTFICKPAMQTPCSALALAELAHRAGVPAGVFNVIMGKATAIGGEMTSNPIVRKITFTGSTAIGKKLMEQFSSRLKKLSLELGGNAPFIVFEDADLDAAVQGAIASKYRNTGQTCVCANRLLVQDSVYEAFTRKLVEAVAKLRVGDGLKGPTDQGPVMGIFPNDAAITRLVGALLLEQNDEWQLQRRYMQLKGLQTLTDNQSARLSAVVC